VVKTLKEDEIEFSFNFRIQGRVVQNSRKFGLQLVEELVVPHIRRRMMTPTLQNFIKEKCRVYLRKCPYTSFLNFLVVFRFFIGLFMDRD